ncbi:MAG: CDP-archaeol synthase [Patescibacteria group bacterium]
MEAIIIFVLRTVWYFLPIGIANMLPVIFRRWFKWLAVPIDGGRTVAGQPIFGPNKTLRGLVVAVLGGTLIFVIQRYAYINSDFFRSLSLIDYEETPLLLGALEGFGAMVGDLVKSFFKRRRNLPPGKSWFPFDQIDFTLGGMIFGFIIYIPPLAILLFSIILGALLHIASNITAKAIGIRKTAW